MIVYNLNDTLLKLKLKSNLFLRILSYKNDIIFNVYYEYQSLCLVTKTLCYKYKSLNSIPNNTS